MDGYTNFDSFTSTKNSVCTMKINGNDEDDANGKSYRVEADFRRTFFQKHFKFCKVISGLTLLLLVLIAILLAWLVIFSLSKSDKDKSIDLESKNRSINYSRMDVVHHHIHYIQSVDGTSESPKIIETNEENHDFTTAKSEESHYATRGVTDGFSTRESSKIAKTSEKYHNFTTVKSEERYYTTKEIIDDFSTRKWPTVTATTKTSTDLSTTVNVFTKSKLWMYHTIKRASTLLHEMNGTVVAFEIFDERIFWTEVDSSKIMSRRMNDPLNATDTIFEDTRVKPRAMAIDGYTGNLYLVDESAGTLVIMNVFTRKYALLATDLDEPREIQLDSSEGLLFVLQKDAITRLFLDGTGRADIERGRFHAIGIDVYEKRIYRVDAIEYISSSDYQGELQVGNHKPWMARSLIVKAKSGNFLAALDSNIDNADSINFYRSFEIDEHSRNNSCSVNNGGCQHLCLLTHDKDRSCACHMGWQLNDDLASCSKVQDFLLYTIDKKVRARNMDFDSNVSVDVIWPTRFDIQSLEDRDTVMFEYDARNDEFYFVDDYNIYKMKLLDYREQSVVYNVKNHSSSLFIASMAYDWLTRNIYYVLNYSHKWSIFYFNVDLGAQSQKSLTAHLHDHMLTPFDLVVHPNLGYLFYKTGYDIDQLYVQRAFLNGTRLAPIGLINYFPRNKLIAVDHDDGRIYWISDVTLPIVAIQHAKFDGSDVKTIEVRLPYAKDVKSIYVHRDWLYLGSYATVVRVHKMSGNGMVKILPGAMNKNLSAVSDGDRIRVDGVQVISSGLQSRILG